MTLAIVISDVIFCIEMVISAFEIQARNYFFLEENIGRKKHRRIRSSMLFPFAKIGGPLHYKYLNRHVYFLENTSKLLKRTVYFFSPNHV